MLIGLGVRDVVLIERLDLAFGPGLTALTGETGAGKSIILDALGLTVGARADAGLVRRGADQASATAIFAPGAGHAAWSILEEKGLGCAPDEDLVLRRTLSADGRSRAFVNDQPVTVAVLRELGALLVEVHGQHETVGLLDAATHRPLLDAFGGLAAEAVACAEAWSRWRAAREKAAALKDAAGRSAAEAEEFGARLAELDRLDPREGEETELAGDRALLGAAEKMLADIAQAARGLRRRRARSAARRIAAGAGAGQGARARHRRRRRRPRLAPDRRGDRVGRVARSPSSPRPKPPSTPPPRRSTSSPTGSRRSRSGSSPCAPPPASWRSRSTPCRLRGSSWRRGCRPSSTALQRPPRPTRPRPPPAPPTPPPRRRSASPAAPPATGSPRRSRPSWRRCGSTRRASASPSNPLPEERAGPAGADRVQFEIATNPGAPFGPLGSIASGGELSRFALALKVALAGRGGAQPLMIFDEVDQGVGGAVADAVGLRLKRLASESQVFVVTHSPQIAARADSHWRVIKQGEGDRVRTEVEVLGPAPREEEIARMLSGAEITEAARAAARALMHA